MHHQFKESVGVVAFDREMPEERGEDVISIFMDEKGIHAEADMTENQCHQYAMSHGATVRDGSVATQEEGFESMTAGVSEIENFPQSALLGILLHNPRFLHYREREKSRHRESGIAEVAIRFVKIQEYVLILLL